MSDEVRSAARAVFFAMLPFAAMAALAPWLPVGKVAAALLAFALAAAGCTGAAVFAPRGALARPRVAAATVVVGVALALASYAMPPVASGLVGTLGLMLAACAAGVTVGSRVQSAGHLLPVALLSAAVDLWSVTSTVGPTHAIVRNRTLLQLLTVRIAVPPTRAPEPAIGFGDVVFAALYVAVSGRFELSIARTAAALYAGFVLAEAVATALQAPVPALPMLGIAVVLAHPEARRVPAADRKATAFAAALLAMAVARVGIGLLRG